jgi:hypothetical protein
VNRGDLESTTKNPQYYEKERIFLDANDIQKYVPIPLVVWGSWKIFGYTNSGSFG